MLQFPPALYHYITGELQKQVILVLNKVDLCPAPLVLAWKHYLSNYFPHLQCVCFTSHPGQPYSSCESTLHMHQKKKKSFYCSNILVERFFNHGLCIPVTFLSLYLSSCCSVSEKANEKKGWVGPGRRANPHSESMSGDHCRKRSDMPTM